MTEFAPMKMESTEVKDLARFVNDDEWVLEQKVDGVRCMAVVTPERITFLTHGGRALSHAAAAQWFDHLRAALAPLQRTGEEMVLDGELMPSDGTYWLFDLPRYGAIVAEHEPMNVRRAGLEMVVRIAALGEAVKILPQSIGPMAKANLAAQVERAGAEGVVAKRLDAPYEHGRRVKHTLKAKFVKTADCVVLARSQEPLNATLGMYDPSGRLVEVGRCSMIGKPDAQVGEVVEVRYLYSTESGTLYQPNFERQRPDRVAEECLTAQLRTVNRDVIPHGLRAV